MLYALLAWLLVCLLELALWSKLLWRWRKGASLLLIVLVTGTNLWLFTAEPSLFTGVVLFISAYRIFNLARVLEDRMNTRYLGRVSMRTSAWLIVGQLAAIWLRQALASAQIGAYDAWYILAGLQTVAATILLISTERHLRTTRPPVLTKNYSDKELPTLTVAIPARNETESLDECLRSIIASDYPKLEVLVLDDCSQTKKTPEIIRGFAHNGVEFIKGQEPKEGWLAKNQAYERLLTEANGELVLFLGVDVRFEKGALRSLVTTLLQKNKSMISLMPANLPPHGAGSLKAMLIQPVRYIWEISLPRRLFNRPPVLSTCWLARKNLLVESGGFAAISRSIVPESYFAKQAIKHGDSYSFMRSEGAIAVKSAKTYAQQRDTAVRTRYPQLHKRPELVCLSALIQILLILGSPMLLIGSIVVGGAGLAVLGALGTLLLIYFYARVVTLTYREFLPASLYMLPAAVISHLWLLHCSMWQYEFSTVIWKGRNVCLPVMRVVSALPSLDDHKVAHP